MKISKNNFFPKKRLFQVFYEDLVESFPVAYFPGGASLNVARGYQWILQKNTKLATMSGSVGNDKNAQILSKLALDHGVTPAFYKIDGQKTGTCACLVQGKTRSLK